MIGLVNHVNIEQESFGVGVTPDRWESCQILGPSWEFFVLGAVLPARCSPAVDFLFRAWISPLCAPCSLPLAIRYSPSAMCSLPLVRNRNSDGPLDGFFHFPHQRWVYESGKGSTEQERFIQSRNLLALSYRGLS